MTNLTVGIPVEGGEMQLYVAHPSTPNGGAIVVLHEIFGVNANIRSIADSYAEKGYMVAAPDLFWRQEPGVDLDPSDPASREPAMALMGGLDFAKALDDAQAAANWLSKQKGVTGKVGALGFCLGGNLAFQLTSRPGIDAIAVYYGTKIHTVLGVASGFEGKAVLHVAGDDYLCPPEAQNQIAEAFEDDEHVTVSIYPGAGHAFARVNGEHYDAAAAAKANSATDLLFSKTLPGSTS